MDDQACPRCKTTKYRKKSLKLMVNVCGHTLCESCVDLLFLKGSGSCPQCMVPLRRNNFRVQMFEDPFVEKEVDIRRRILRDYNKKEDDFATLQEYNDYLEEIEELVYNLTNDIDVIETNKRIEAYKRDNREQILRNKSRVGREELELEELLELERLQEETRRQELLEKEQEVKKAQIKVREALIEELMRSEKDASEIVNEFSQRAKKTKEESKKLPPLKTATQFSTGIKFGRTQPNLKTDEEDEGPPFVYTPPVMICEGPTPPSVQDIESKGYINHIRAETVTERAGGYRANLACQRALQEALQGLYQGAAIN